VGLTSSGEPRKGSGPFLSVEKPDRGTTEGACGRELRGRIQEPRAGPGKQPVREQGLQSYSCKEPNSANNCMNLKERAPGAQ